MSKGDVIAVALIEDNRLVREGITALLNQMPDFDVFAAGSSADAALLRVGTPHMVLLDLGLRNGDSLRMAERVKKEFPEASKMFEKPIMDREYFRLLTDQFRSPHLWYQENGEWKLRHQISNEKE